MLQKKYWKKSLAKLWPLPAWMEVTAPLFPPVLLELDRQLLCVVMLPTGQDPTCFSIKLRNLWFFFSYSNSETFFYIYFAPYETRGVNTKNTKKGKNLAQAVEFPKTRCKNSKCFALSTKSKILTSIMSWDGAELSWAEYPRFLTNSSFILSFCC